MNITEFKESNPAYKDVPDEVLAEKLHAKFYKDKIPLEAFKDKVMPKAGWLPTIGTAIMRGGSEAAAGLGIAAGGLVKEALRQPSVTPEGKFEVAPETEAFAEKVSDPEFQFAEETHERGQKYWQPKGRQSTAQKIVGGIAEPVLPLLAAGGSPSLYAGTKSIESAAERVRGGMSAEAAAALAPIEAGGTYAAFALPIKGVKQAVASQVAVATAEESLKLQALKLHQDDPAAKKEAAQILENFLPDIGLSALSGLGGATLLKIINSIPGAKAKWSEKFAKEPEAKPEAAPEKPIPTTPPVQPTEAKPAHAFGGMPAIDEPSLTKPMKEKVREAKQLEKERQTAEFEVWADDQGASDLSDMSLPQQEAKVAPVPSYEGIDREAKLMLPTQEGELVHMPVIMKRGNSYAGARVVGLSDVDRASIAVAKGGESFQPKSHTVAQLGEALERAGIPLERAKAHGEQLMAEIKRQHAENVQANGGKWNNPKGNALPIYPHGRPVGMTAERAIADQSVQEIQKIVDKTPDVHAEAEEPPMRASAATEEKYARMIETQKKRIASVENDPDRVHRARTIDDAKKQLKALGIKLSAERRAFTGKLTDKEFASTLRRLSAELRRAGGVSTDLAKKLNFDTKRLPFFFKKDGMQADALQAFMRERGWIPEHDAAHADEHEPGGATDLAIEKLAEEIENVGSVRHPVDIERVAEREKIKEHLDNLDKLKNPVARGVAAAGLIVASEAAKADDGSDTPTSNMLAYAGVALALGVGYANRNQIKAAMSAGLRDSLQGLFKDVKETGAKPIVDQWKAYYKIAARKVVGAAAQIVKRNKGISAHELAANPEFQANVDYIAKTYQQARWKDRENLGMSLGAAFDHWDEKDPRTREVIEAFRAAEGEEKITDFPMFSYENGGKGIEAGLIEGMKLKGQDSGQVFANFALTAFDNIARGQQIRALKNLKLPTGKPAMSQTEPGYVRIGEAWGGTLADLEGWKVHPDLVNDFKLSFDTYKPGSVSRTLMGINLAVKRSEVGLSGFHAMSLGQAKLNDIVGRAMTGDMPKFDGMAAARAVYEQGGKPVHGNLDALDLGLAKGLELTSPIEATLGKQSAYHALDVTEEALNRTGLKLGLAAKGIKEADKAIQHFTWDYLHTNFKIMTYLKEFERQAAQNPEKDLHKIAEEVAEYTNDIFGSIDWRRVGYQFKSRWGRNIAAEVFSGQGRFWMDMAMFAPDWFFATSRSWLLALPRAKDGKIVWDDRSKLYARYLVGGAMAYIAIGEALNYALSGHSMLDNESTKKNATASEQIKAKMMVDMGDGRSLQLSKHFTDFPDVLLEPGKAVANKMGVAPATALDLIMNKPYMQSPYPITYSEAPAYMSPTAAADVAAFLGKKVTPISAQALFGEGDMQDRLVRAGLGMAGIPPRGYTAEEKAAMRGAEKEKKRSERE